MENENQELLEGVTISDVGGSQYMIQPIPRMSVDSPQLLGSELLQHHTGVVLDLAGDFIPVSYGSEELLTQELTEEDRNLAAALVAVQLSQQQKHHIPPEGNVMINGIQPLCGGEKLSDQQIVLSDKATISNGYLHIVDSENIYKQNLIPKLCFDSRDFSPADVYDRNEEILSIKSEKEIELATTHRDSDGEHKSDSRSSKKSLPHKKRISRKLRKTSTSIRKVYKCSLCEQVYNNSDEFSTHQRLCQTTITPIHPLFTCQICSASYHDQLRFFEHLKGHYEPNILVQETLTVEEKPKQEFKQHTATKQQENVISSIINTCLQCNKTFRRQKTYEAHIREYHNKDDLQEFSEPEDLMDDIDVNPNVQPVIVDTKEWYHREDELQATEEDLRELEAQDSVCPICKRQFPMRSALHEHSLACKEVEINETKVDSKKSKKKVVEFKCTECPRIFNHKNSLVYHMRGHTGIRPHTCDQCGKSFFAASALKVHLRLHSGDKPYCCEYCGKYFRQWGDLKYHCVSIHSDRKQYQCDYCGKDFARKYSLIVHRRIHTGEKNYKCEFCSKTFRASSYLQNHRRIHTGEKPHCCDICGKRFRVRSDMKRHMLTHNRKRGRPGDPTGSKDDLKEQENIETILPDEDYAEQFKGGDIAVTPPAIQELQYEQDPLDGIRDANTLYVMPILIS